jgi:hypothetical protein
MLNKELLMAGSTDLEPVLSIYISPDVLFMPSVSGALSSGEPFYVRHTGETTFKFSEIDLTASININYDEGTLLSTSNLTAYPSREGISRAPSIVVDVLYIADRTQSASISLV